ncbi:Uncharacterised protein [Neisseria meningitidis]|nr:Uncharacterised protein [Neisseria meningitidis]CWS37511.1 Uncharacterised protein [Neisseria meningitidis]
MDNAANLRTDIGGTQRFQTSRQLDGQRNGLRMDGYDTDDGSRCFPTRRLPALRRVSAFTARRQYQCNGGSQRGRTHRLKSIKSHYLSYLSGLM